MNTLTSPQIIGIILTLCSMVVLIFVLVRLFIQTRKYGTPFVRSTPAAIQQLLDHMQRSPGRVFIDMGCGDGTVMQSVVAAFPHRIARWYELLSTVQQLSAHLSQTHASRREIIHADYATASIHDADSIYCYMLPHLLPSIRRTIQKQCRPGTVFYTNVFSVAWATPSEKIIVHDVKKTTYIYVYIVPQCQESIDVTNQSMYRENVMDDQDDTFTKDSVHESA
jgi:trans-aconitate methyltransferase